MQTANKRLLHIDVLKIIAIYMVLFNHTGSYGFVLFTIEQYSFWYPFYLFNAIFIKIAVPLFFMTSGALLLGKEESYVDILRKRFLKYFLLLIVGSVVEYLYACLRMNHESISVAYFFKTLYTSKHATAYWYFYAYLAYLLTLPFLRKLAKSLESKDYLWMILLYFVMRALSIFDFLC